MDSPREQIQKIKKRLPMQYFNSICKDIELSKKHLARIIQSSESNLVIRKKEGVFSFSESERLFRIRRVYKKALEVFDDEKEIKKWFKKPCWLLNDVAPIDYLDTEIGSREIENILQHIKIGTFGFALPI